MAPDNFSIVPDVFSIWLRNEGRASPPSGLDWWIDLHRDAEHWARLLEGSRLLVQSQITQGDILAITLSTCHWAFSLGYVAPNIQHIAAGIAAAKNIRNHRSRIAN